MHFGVWKKQRSMLLAILAVVLAGIPAFPQLQSGRIVGNVYDPQHASVSNATVTVVNAATSLIKTLTTDSDGNYVVTPLDPGSYNVRVTAQGSRLRSRTELS